MSQSKKRTPWLDEKGETLLIDDHAKKLGTFVAALEDGRVEKHELDAVEKELVVLLKEIEPKLDDTQHELVTRLLVEVSAYSIMQTLYEMEGSRIRKLVL
jgi:hypothetical protein